MRRRNYEAKAARYRWCYTECCITILLILCKICECLCLLASEISMGTGMETFVVRDGENVVGMGIMMRLFAGMRMGKRYAGMVGDRERNCPHAAL